MPGRVARRPHEAETQTTPARRVAAWAQTRGQLLLMFFMPRPVLYFRGHGNPRVWNVPSTNHSIPPRLPRIGRLARLLLAAPSTQWMLSSFFPHAPLRSGCFCAAHKATLSALPPAQHGAPHALTRPPRKGAALETWSLRQIARVCALFTLFRVSATPQPCLARRGPLPCKTLPPPGVKTESQSRVCENGSARSWPPTGGPPATEAAPETRRIGSHPIADG